MKEVTKEVFYNFINPLDIVVSVENINISLFKYRNGNLAGKVAINNFDYKYFLNN